MARTNKPIREEAMQGYSGGPKAKHLIKNKDDHSLENTYEMSKHGRELTKRVSIANMDPDDLQKEVDDFVEYCIEKRQVPSKVGLSIWLGVTVATINRWEGEGTTRNGLIFKSFDDFCHKFLEQKALDGEMHPVLFMFYSKNWFGLSDKTEIVHKSQTTQVIDIREQQRILRSAPGIVVDAEFTEKPENLAIGNSENLDRKIPENLGIYTQAENLGISESENLGDLLLGAENLDTEKFENLGTSENLDTFSRTDTYTDTYTENGWETDDL